MHSDPESVSHREVPIRSSQAEVPLIEDPAALEAACADLARSSWLAVDTEFVREKTYFPQLCLVQVASADRAYCIDPLRVPDINPLLDLLYAPERVKVLHAASQDFEIFYWLRGALPQPLFDTQIAASALGQGEQCSYAALVDQILGVTLAKSQTRTDWCRRPLSAAQLEYAADDVIYLGRMYPLLREMLEQRGRDAWVSEECLRVCDTGNYTPEGRLNWRKLPGAHELGARHLAVLRALALWREHQACKENRPRQWLVPDIDLVTLAYALPDTSEALAGLDFNGNGSAVKRRAPTLIEVIGMALEEPEENWPRVIERPAREEVQRVQAAMQFLRDTAARHEISPSLLATRAEIEALLRGEETARLLKGWRRELLGPDLSLLLQAATT